jgi:hypothetical protein
LFLDQWTEDFTDENVWMGKAVNRDKPGSAQVCTSSTLMRVSWDLFGPTAAHSFAVHKHCAVFVDHHTQYDWVYMLKEKSEMSDTLEQFYADTARIRKVIRFSVSFVTELVNLFQGKSSHGCEKKSIRPKTSAPREPWQNGKAEN